MPLAPYVPRLAMHLTRGVTPPLEQPRIEALDASVLLADLSGFAALADKLSEHDPDRGAERLQEVLNQCFGPLTRIVADAGGEVLSFPGDAALAVWTASGGEGVPLATLAERSVACGLALLSRLDRFAARDIDLRLRVVVGAGRCWGAVVGGVNGHWHTVLRGEATDQLAAALDLARAGEVVLSPEAAVLIGGAARRGERRGAHVVFGHATSPPALPPVRVADLPGIDAALLRSFVPPFLLERTSHGQLAWFAEFRTATVAFVQLTGIPWHGQAALHEAVSTIQTIAARFEGAVTPILSDDKGLTVIVVFGALHRAHEDDAERAARAALAVLQERHGPGEVRIGIATGRVFVGHLGGDARRDITVLGPAVVLASRLAAAAESILCDRETRTACSRAIRFEARPAVAIKGKVERIDVWKPFSVTLGPDASRDRLVGRSHERSVLEARLIALEREGRGGVVLLEGEPGIGKSAIVDDVLTRARGLAVRSFCGKGDSIEQRTAYLAWKPVVADLVGLDVAHDPQAMTGRLLRLLRRHADPWLPVLNSVLPSPLPENERTAGLTVDGRARATRDLVIQLLTRAADALPLLVVFEDAHWMDAASWELVEDAVARVPRLLVLVSTRRMASGGLERLAARDDTAVMRLGPLSAADISDLVCRRLHVQEIPEELSTFVCARSEGHPLFAVELALALRDRGAVAVQDGVCRVVPEVFGDLGRHVPATVQGVVATRIDQLAPEEQLTLKVAAVLGRTFRARDLAGIHPLPEAGTSLDAQLAAIAQSGLLVQGGEDNAFSFSHAIVQEVAYGLLPFMQRRELHHRTAAWLEQTDAESLDDLAPLLAHHWERAEAVDKTVHYLDRAAERALRRHSSDADAEDFLVRLVRLADSVPPSADDPMVYVPGGGWLRERAIRLARWERLLGETLGRRGRHREGLAHLERSLAFLGQRVPRPTLATRAELVVRTIARLARRPRPARRVDRAPMVRFALIEIALTYEKYVEFLYLDRSDLTGSIVGTLRSVRAAELAGPSAEMSRAYSFFANVVAMFGRHQLAEHYASRSLEIATAIDDHHARFRALTTGHLPAFIRGEWTRIESALTTAVALAAKTRIVHERLISEYALAHARFNQGEMADASERFRDIRARAESHGALVPRLWATVSIGEVALRQGRIQDAIAWAQEALVVAARHHSVDQNTRFQAHGLLASAWLLKEGPARARAHITDAMAAAEAGARLSYAPQSGFVGVAEALFALIEEEPDRAQEHAAQLARWLRMLRLTAFSRPILQPWDLFFRALRNVHAGRRWLGLRQLRRAVRVADRMSLAYEAGRARTELARVLGPRHPDTHRLLEEAGACLQRIGATRAALETQALRAQA